MSLAGHRRGATLRVADNGIGGRQDRSGASGALDKDPDLREAEEQASREIGLEVEIRGHCRFM